MARASLALHKFPVSRSSRNFSPRYSGSNFFGTTPFSRKPEVAGIYFRYCWTLLVANSKTSQGSPVTRVTVCPLGGVKVSTFSRVPSLRVGYRDPWNTESFQTWRARRGRLPAPLASGKNILVFHDFRKLSSKFVNFSTFLLCSSFGATWRTNGTVCRTLIYGVSYYSVPLTSSPNMSAITR